MSEENENSTPTFESEVARIKNAVTAAYNVCKSKGANISDEEGEYQPIDNLSSAIQEASSLFGLTASDLIANVDGALSWKAPANWINSEITGIATTILSSRWSLMDGPEEINLPNLASIGNYGMQYMCDGNTGLKRVILPNCATVGQSGLYFAFRNSSIQELNLGIEVLNKTTALSYICNNCQQLTTVTMNKLQTVEGTGSMSYAFANTPITTMTFPALSKLSRNNSFSATFKGCTQLTDVYFPALTTVDVSYPFGTASATACFYGTTTTVHFRSDMEETISGLTGFSTNFGGAAVVFDL